MSSLERFGILQSLFVIVSHSIVGLERMHFNTSPTPGWRRDWWKFSCPNQKAKNVAVRAWDLGECQS